jgi:filamentous hemagglutinin family protein
MARSPSLLLLLPLLPLMVKGQVLPGGLGTRVNGSAFGSCTSGVCTISGGTKAGKNLFHRFSQFDTRGRIVNVRLDTQGKNNVIVGVTHPTGTLIDKPFQLSRPANLFWLSPRGIWIGPGAEFVNATNLLLSTSPSVRLGNRSWNAFNATAEDTERIVDAPSIKINDLSSASGSMASLELDGNGSIVLDGGLISVERSLFVNATRGTLRSTPGAGTRLQAGSTVRLAGHDLQLSDIQINAGSNQDGGIVDLQTNPDTVEIGAAVLEKTSIGAQHVSIRAGEISLARSRVKAPMGTIQLQTINPGELPNNLTLSNTVLDVGAKTLADLQAPSLPQSGNQTLARSKPTPSISLLSNGEINLRDSSLNASLDFSKANSLQSFASSIANNISDSSGTILLDSEGGVNIDSSTLSANASHSLAGRILIRARDGEPYGGVRIVNSDLSTSFGAGNGVITVESFDGISILGSTFDSSNDRFPVVNGSNLAPRPDGEDGRRFPLTFTRSQIWLVNRSTEKPILVIDSNLSSRRDSKGGPFESPQLSHVKQLFNDDGSPFRVGGTYGNLNAFILGYEFYHNSVIEVISSGGISLNNSQFDVSSGPYAGQQLDVNGGYLGIVNTESADLEINHSTLSAKTGSSADPGIDSLLTGSIFVANRGAIRISDSIFDASNSSPAVRYDESDLYSYPNITIVSLQPLVLKPGNLIASDLAVLNGGAPPADGAAFYGVFLSGEANFLGQKILPQPQFVELSEDSFSILDSYKIFVEEADLEGLTDPAKQLLNSSGDVQGSVRALNPALLPQTMPMVPPISEQISMTLGESEVSSQLLEAARRSLQNTTRGLGLPAGSGKLLSIADLQARLSQAKRNTQALPKTPPEGLPTSSEHSPTIRPYSPAILHLQRDDQPSGLTRITAILLIAHGEPISRSIDLPRADLDAWIRRFQRQLSRRQPSGASPAGDPSARKLSQILIDPLLPTLRQQGITALLMEVDRGLQAIPYGALPVDGRLLGDSFAITITPSLGLIDLDPSLQADRGNDGQMLLAGATDFSNGLEPLPMVRQELQALAAEHRSTLLLNDAFTDSALKQRALATDVHRLHIATHANFLPGQSTAGLLYTPTAALSLADLGRSLRTRSSTSPLDLISLSGCVTALGDEQSELGFVGMALQAGARSGLGTLWEVDDAATAAFFIQFYRYLQFGLSKDIAFQATQRAFLNGDVQLQGDRLVGPAQLAGPSKTVLLSGLSRQEHTLFSQGLSHPYYWAGMVLTGSPW